MTTLSFTPVAGAIFPSQDAPGIPPLADFSPTIDAELSWACADIDRTDFIAAVWEHAAAGALTFSPMTHAGCFLAEDGRFVPDSIDLSADEANAQALAAMEFCPEFFNEYAHEHLHSIVQAMLDWRDDPARIRAQYLEDRAQVLGDRE